MITFRRWLVLVALAITAAELLLVAPASSLMAAEPDSRQSLSLELRKRSADGKDSDRFRVEFKPAEWTGIETALIICDMWDNHWCPTAAERTVELAPRINDFANACRNRGVVIVHAPSDCMAFYADHPARRRAQAVSKIQNLPDGIDTWCRSIPAEERGKYPIDQTDGGCDCENPPKSQIVWKRQIDTIEIDGQRDYVSANGSEIWSIFDRHGVKNVMLVGVHTNMCVLGRPFGLRNMARFGKNAVLVRDLTDTMYNPKAWPYVNHFRGTQLIVEHIEKYVCPTITSNQVLGGLPFRFKEDDRPRVVFAIAEPEYKTHETLPVYAAEELETKLGYDTLVVEGDPKQHQIPNLGEAIDTADLLFISIRRQALPASELAAIRRYLEPGRPLVGIRTASHAFDARGTGPEGSAQWPTFDAEVLGGNYTGHHGKNVDTTVTLADGAKEHRILKGVETPFASKATLYKTKPLNSSATPLLIGTIPGSEPEPVAWTNTYSGGRIFYTSLGHEEDFKNENFVRMLTNAVEWCLQR